MKISNDLKFLIKNEAYKLLFIFARLCVATNLFKAISVDILYFRSQPLLPKM